MTNKYKYFSGIIVILFCIILDQASKLYLIQHLKSTPGMKVPVLSFLDFVFTWNHGASFSFLAGYYQYSNIGFFVLNTFILMYIFWLFVESDEKLEAFSYTCMIGGGIGNLVDRVMHGAVFDFIRFHYLNLDFPIFNLADSFITIGSILLLIEFISKRNKHI